MRLIPLKGRGKSTKERRVKVYDKFLKREGNGEVALYRSFEVGELSYLLKVFGVVGNLRWRYKMVAS